LLLPLPRAERSAFARIFLVGYGRKSKHAERMEDLRRVLIEMHGAQRGRDAVLLEPPASESSPRWAGWDETPRLEDPQAGRKVGLAAPEHCERVRVDGGAVDLPVGDEPDGLEWEPDSRRARKNGAPPTSRSRTRRLR